MGMEKKKIKVQDSLKKAGASAKPAKSGKAIKLKNSTKAAKSEKTLRVMEKTSAILARALQRAKGIDPPPLKKMAVESKLKSVTHPVARNSSRSLGGHPKSQVTMAAVANAQQEVERSKFEGSEPVSEHYYPGLPQELPERYGEDKIVLQIRDPWWVHTYWEIQPASVESIKQKFGEAFNGAKSILRVYDVSYIVFDGTNAHKFFDIEIPVDARNWYIDLGGPGRSWCVDLGFRLADGRFIMLARSNVVVMPLDGPSWQTDEEWLIPDELFARLYHLGFGFNPSSPVGKEMAQRFRFPVTSMGLFSPSSPVGASWSGKGKKPFWLVVNTELIVYGATEPDAKVTVKGQPIKLNADGTFSLRFSLPDGQQTIAVEATSADGEESRSVTPVVSKETH